jgi:hypothetical protein
VVWCDNRGEDDNSGDDYTRNNLSQVQKSGKGIASEDFYFPFYVGNSNTYSLLHFLV